MAAIFLLSGVFRSVGFTGYNTLQFADVPAEQMNGASTLSSTVTQLANGLGWPSPPLRQRPRRRRRR